jgi:hypothetical protein
MSAHLEDVRTDFNWQPQPEAARFIARLLRPCLQSSTALAKLAARMQVDTGTRLVDWVDSISVADSPTLGEDLVEAGFEQEVREPGVWRHRAGIFPVVCVGSASGANGAAMGIPSQLAVKVASVDDFAAAMGEFGQPEIAGPAGGQLRVCTFPATHGTQLAAIERHGWPSFVPPSNRAQQIAAAAKHRRTFSQRRRNGASDAKLFEHALALFDAAAADLGRDWACDLFFAAEREYWMSRNAAARAQFERQQKLGLGWGNHDHHTYRSSREAFSLLIAALEHMGFECRERFYAGRDAGWGAQVIEQPNCGVVIFADVDLTPVEVAGDFAHETLEPQGKLGTVGLWCKLHGEAFLAAGMHHLECQFDFDAVRRQLAELGVESLTPFTDWAHLKQAFTKGEMWPVADERLERALAERTITAEQATQFRRDGALGSHMEILERNDGFKGFNQTGISEIILRTDPRTANAQA